jgi:nitroreductase
MLIYEKGKTMFIDLLRKRRSIRQFNPKAVELEKIEQLVEAMLRSPSSRSLNPWGFIVVEDNQTIEALSRSKPHGASFLKNAPLAIVVYADPEKCDVWVEDCSIATLNIHYAATDLGLGSCWIQIRKREHDGELGAEEYVKEKLNIPADRRVEAIVAIGYPKEEQEGRPLSSLPYDKVCYEKYGRNKS